MPKKLRDEEICKLTADYRELVQLACMSCDCDWLGKNISISWNGRFTARMGDARWNSSIGRGFIRLSSPLWPHADDNERAETVIHEACHIIADAKSGRRQGHGNYWREMMALCGYPNASRCHTVNLQGIRKRRLAKRTPAYCGCSEYRFTRYQAERLRNTSSTPRCGRCGHEIRFDRAKMVAKAGSLAKSNWSCHRR